MAANAADLARNNYARAYPPPSAFNWTGLYAGAHLGYGWDTSNRDTFVSTTGAFYSSSTLKSDGIFGGIQLGYNYQIERLVIGWEADLSLANINGSLTSLTPAGNQIGAVSNGKDKTLGTVRARLGYAFNNVMFYGTGGVAFRAHDGSRTQYATAAALGVAPDMSTTPVFVEKNNSSSIGGTIGGGAEYAFDRNWSVNASYSYTKWSNQHTSSPLALTSVFSYVAPGVANGRELYSSSSTQSMRMGVNYKF